ncbi:retrograde regulation protein 2 [Metarhizium brunneum]
MVIGNHGKPHLEPGRDGACTDDAPVSNEDIDAAAERRLVRKLDVIIIPTFFIIYMMSFLDRINISNARIQDMPKDLDLSGKKFNVALLVYYASYILLEIPSNMIVKKVRPSLYMSTLMFIWGVVNMCMGFVHSYQALVGLRFMLGVFEAGVLPAIVYITSTYYKRHECQKRMSLLFCSTVVAGAFGGLLAFAIGKLGGREGFRAWRWIFIIEGAITALLAIVASFTIIDWPEQTKYLNKEEKELLRRRVQNDVGDMVRMDTLNKFSIQLIASDYKIWLGGLMYFGVGVAGLSGAMFLPTILVEFHWEPEQAQVRTIPVYVFAAGTMLLGAYASDRLKHRFGFIVGGASMTTVGYAMLLSQDGKTRDYKFAAVFLVFGGAYMIAPMALVWLQNNVSGHWKRSFAASTQVMVGNVAGIVGSLIFVPAESPRYTTGYSVSLSLMWVGICAALAMFMLMRRENGKRAAGRRDDRLALPEDVQANLGDWHPSFRFTL